MDHNPVLGILSLFWTLILVTLYNLLAFLRNLIPVALWPLKDVSKDIVLITGGGSGIGRLMCLEFGKLGSTVVIWDINGGAAQEVVKEIRALGGKAQSYVVDCSDNEEVYKVADKVREEVGHVTMLINNAGIVTGKKFLDCPDSHIKKTMDVNINAHFWTLKAFLPHMIEKNHGHIVTIASLAGFSGYSHLVDYCTSKFAAVGLDDALYHELYYSGKRGVKCTVVCPYYINTGMFEGVKLSPTNMIPILEPDFVVKEIMTGIRTNKRNCVIPKALTFYPALKNFWSTEAIHVLNERGGFHEAMVSFIGRAKQN